MITAVDTSVLLDVLSGDPTFGPASRDATLAAIQGGVVVACEAVWCETRAAYLADQPFVDAVGTLGVEFTALTAEASLVAGQLWRAYRAQHPKTRERIVADFLIGAHAQLQADALLTRDRGFYREFFKDLRIIDPTRRTRPV